jgi:Uma2 family endonuclease
MILIETQKATLDDLHRVPGKAELVGERIVHFMSTGLRPGRVARNILFLIAEFLHHFGRGEVLADNVGYAIPKLPSGRQSFSPDVSYYDGPEPDDDMEFIPGAPAFAIEVRSKDGYGKAALKAASAKRADYFAAGTKVVWDVDTQAECIHVYSMTEPTIARTFKRGESADAEPALPGWRVGVDAIFRK